MTRTEWAIAQYLMVAPSLVARRFHAGSPEHKPGNCISSVAIGLRVFRALGFQAAPLSVEVVVTGPPPERYSIGCVRSQPLQTHDWYGHLALCVNRRHLVDIATSQFNRPQHGIAVGAAYGPLDAGQGPFIAGAGWLVGTWGASEIAYRAWHENTGYTASPDWRNQDGRLDDTVAAILSAMEAVHA